MFELLRPFLHHPIEAMPLVFAVPLLVQHWGA